MKLLSLDLGITTGYAVISDNGVLDAYGDIPDTILSDILPHLLSAHKPRWVVAETPLIFRGPLGDKLTTVVNLVTGLCPDAKHVTPSEWKDSWWGQNPSIRKLLTGLTSHEKDAIRMGWWYLDTQLKTSNIRGIVLDVDVDLTPGDEKR